MAVNIRQEHLFYSNAQMMENFNHLFTPVYDDTFVGGFKRTLLGAGAMGAVFECKFPQHGNPVAVKVGEFFRPL
jgi:hypothetical protein